MTNRTWAFLLAILTASLTLIAFGIINSPPPPFPWLTFAALALLGLLVSSLGISDAFPTRFHFENIFFFAGLFLLPFWMYCLLTATVLLAAWGQTGRRTPAGQLIAVMIGILAGGCAYAVLYGFNNSGASPLSTFGVLSIVGAGLAFAVVKQVLAGLVDQLLNGVNWNEPAVLSDIVLLDFPLTCLGYSAVLAWNFNPWLMLLMLAPLILVSRAFQTNRQQAHNLESLQQRSQELALANQAMQSLNSDLFRTIAQVFDARDPYVGGHAAQVSAYAVAIARELHLPQERIDIIRQAGYLHDVGKIAIPESVLHKAGSLTQEEYRLVQQHTIIGANLIRNCEGLVHLAPFIHQHHERWDGLGYPDRLRGADIALEARILNLCDSVESMTEDMPYHRGMDEEEIIEELRRCRGTQFDPILTDTFIEIIDREGPQFLINPAHGTTARLQPVDSCPVSVPMILQP